MEALRLVANWSSRVVYVEITVHGDLGPEGLEPLRAARVRTIDADDVVSRATVVAFVREVTRHEADDARVEAIVRERDAEQLLDALGVDGPPPATIVVDMEE